MPTVASAPWHCRAAASSPCAALEPIYLAARPVGPETAGKVAGTFVFNYQLEQFQALVPIAPRRTRP